MAIKNSSNSVSAALRDQFDAAVVKIAHRASNFKTGCDRFYGVAKSNSLHMTGIKVLSLAHVSCATIKGTFSQS